MEKPHPAAESQLSKKEQVHDSIVSSVLDGTYPPGTILTEKALVEAFQFSKSPIREALIELCNENILRNIPRLGYEVTRLTEDDIRDIRGLRLSLECDFLIHYGSQITKEEINTLSSALTAEKKLRAQRPIYWKTGRKMFDSTLYFSLFTRILMPITFLRMH